MSTKRHNPTAMESNAIHLPKVQQLQREQQQAVIKVLDETRDVYNFINLYRLTFFIILYTFE